MESDLLLKELNACAILCNMCFDACLKENEVQLMAECIRLNRECADICQFTASFFSSDSVHTAKLVSICADICQKCAEACEKHEHHEHCRKCAITCQTCHEMCKTYLHNLPVSN
jgi:tetrahydromethanopterin S-methyltransferase subunit C